MKKYKYQMHTHTSPCSRCAVMKPQELTEALYKGGYNGCVITNHFFHGNSGIDRKLPWDAFIKHYEQDYLECKKYAEKYDLDIIFGIEEQIYDGLEILCYGITPEFLYNNPQLLYNLLEEWHKTAQSYGALIIQAHPFRDRFYINNPRVFPIEFIDGIEIYNYGNSAENNIMAENFYSKHNDLIITGGADAHDDSILCVSGIETCTRIRNETELVSVLKSGNYAIIK